MIILPAGAVARGKLVQVLAAGAELREIRGTFEDAHLVARTLEKRARQRELDQPDRTKARRRPHAIVEKLGGPPDAGPVRRRRKHHGIRAGFEEAGVARPRMLAVESAARPTTVGSAIRIVVPVHRDEVEPVAEVVTVGDDALLEWWSAVARLEGLFCEPASAAGVAGVAQVKPSGRVVCVLTGHGLKDPDAVDRL